MRWVRSALITAVGIAAACSNPGSPDPTTGLTGIVIRGPITPVCRLDTPCDAPFSAGFTAERNQRQVAQFRSDADGRFTVWLSPGTYQIVPNSDAALLHPASQVKTVDVGNVGLTDVRLEFDTGIR